jgi:MFS family permease
MENNRAFYSVLERVGGRGEYQRFSLVFWSLMFMVSGSVSYFSPFLFYQQGYACPDAADCKEFVCNLAPAQREAFIDPSFTSLASKFGDYRCDGGSELQKLQSFIYFGGVFGMVAGIILNSYITKKKVITLTVVAGMLGLGFTLLASSLYLAAIGLFITFAAVSVQIELIVCCVTESVDEEVRGRHTVMLYIFFSIGATFNGLFFKLIPNWEIVLFLTNIIPLAICLAGLLFYIEETPFDLIINNSPEHSLKVL